MFLKRFLGGFANKTASSPAASASTGLSDIVSRGKKVPSPVDASGNPRPAAGPTKASPVQARAAMPATAPPARNAPTREQLAGRIRQLISERDHHHSFAKRVQLENEDLHKEIARLMEENGYLWDQLRDAHDRGLGLPGSAHQHADDDGLLPCPFCNRPPQWWGPRSHILHCSCPVAPEVDGGSRAESMRIWNMRWHDL